MADGALRCGQHQVLPPDLPFVSRRQPAWKARPLATCSTSVGPWWAALSSPRGLLWGFRGVLYKAMIPVEVRAFLERKEIRWKR